MRLRILGAVIAGGGSRRFGSDKARAELDGRTLLDHVIDGLSLQTHAMVICGRTVEGHKCLPDRPMPGLGPLGGLAAALHHAASCGFDGVLTSACDTPELPADLAAILGGPDAAVVVGQPLFGYWPAQLATELDAYLAHADNRAVGAWAARAGARRVHAGEMANVNTVADLTALRKKRLLAA